MGTGAQNTARAVAISRHAQQAGAAGLMVIPPVLSTGASPSAQEAHFSAIFKPPRICLLLSIIAPHGFETRADLFFRLRENHDNLVGFKEFGGANSLSCAAEHITSGHPDLVLMVGVYRQVCHGFVNCDAVGAISGVGNALLREVLHLVKLCQKAATGNASSRRLAKGLDKAMQVLSTFYLGMCGHGAIGLALPLAYLGLLDIGAHQVETPIGIVRLPLHEPNQASFENVEGYRLQEKLGLDVEGLGTVMEACPRAATGSFWLIRRHHIPYEHRGFLPGSYCCRDWGHKLAICQRPGWIIMSRLAAPKVPAMAPCEQGRYAAKFYTTVKTAYIGY